MNKIKIAVDIDGVLRDIFHSLYEQIYVTHGEELAQKFLNCEKSGSIDSLLEIIGDREKVDEWMREKNAYFIFAKAKQMYSNAIAELNALSQMERYHVELTSVQLKNTINCTYFWLGVNACRVKRVNFYSSHEEKVADIIHRGFDVVIDDQENIVVPCSMNYVFSILVNHVYNKHVEEGENLQRVYFPDCSGYDLEGITLFGNGFRDINKILEQKYFGKENTENGS